LIVFATSFLALKMVQVSALLGRRKVCLGMDDPQWRGSQPQLQPWPSRWNLADITNRIPQIPGMER
jgi:hypothetical protein